MKTILKTTTLLIATLLLSFNTYAGGFEMPEEQYIDDIPFNTEDIAVKARYAEAVSQEFVMEEEEYIDDIPFNTDFLSKVYLSEKALTEDFDMEEEAYINDIPFNTAQIAQSAINIENSILATKK